MSGGLRGCADLGAGRPGKDVCSGFRLYELAEHPRCWRANGRPHRKELQPAAGEQMESGSQSAKQRSGIHRRRTWVATLSKRA